MRKVPVFAPCFDNVESELINKVLSSGWVAQGAMVEEFETTVARHERINFGIAVTSCTTALHLALLAMGLKPNQDVLVPSFTFVATANAVEYVGATPVFVDVDTETYNLDALALEKFIDIHYEMIDNGLVNRKTKNELFGIIPVGLFGLLADMKEISRIAKRYGLKILEDNACSIGSAIDGIKQGVYSDATCLSFHARKSITTGEGGMILTNDEDLAERLKRSRTHGASISAETRHKGYGFIMPNFEELGFNYRMTDIQGAIGVAQMHKLDKIIEGKREIAKRYDNILPNIAPCLKIPHVPSGYFHTYQSYVCMVDCQSLGLTVEDGNSFRNRLMTILEDSGISTRQGTHAIHLLGYYRRKYNYVQSDLPGAYACDRLSIALPLYADLSVSDQDYLIQKISDALTVLKK